MPLGTVLVVGGSWLLLLVLTVVWAVWTRGGDGERD